MHIHVCMLYENTFFIILILAFLKFELAKNIFSLEEFQWNQLSKTSNCFSFSLKCHLGIVLQVPILFYGPIAFTHVPSGSTENITMVKILIFLFNIIN